MAASKKTAARKTAAAKGGSGNAKTAARKVRAKGAAYRVTPLKFDAARVKRVHASLKKGDTLSAIAKREKITKGEAARAELIATEPVTAAGTPAALSAAVTAGRKAGLSWGVLSARYRVTEGTVRAAYEAGTGRTFKAVDYRKRGGRPRNA